MVNFGSEMLNFNRVFLRGLVVCGKMHVFRCGAVVQLVRIPACHAGGREFESRPLRQNIL